MRNLTGAVWRKSSRSNNGGNCVEVADKLSGIVGCGTASTGPDRC